MSLFDHIYKTAEQVAPPVQGTSAPGIATRANPSDSQHTAPVGTGIPGLKPDFMPLPHQINAVRRLIENDGKMIMAHGVGTGKTASSLYGFQKLKQLGMGHKAIVIVPAGLRENYLESGVKRFTTEPGKIADHVSDIDPAATYNIMSYEAFSRDPTGALARSGADTMIADEFHRMRNGAGGSTYRALVAARHHCKNFLGLTGSILNNHPQELADLLRLSEDNPNLTERDFKDKFVRTTGHSLGFSGKPKKLVGIKNEAEFAKDVYPRVDYLETDDVPGNSMPKRVVNTVQVPMSEKQYTAYNLALKKLGPIADFIERRDENNAVKDSDRVFSQIMAARQIANSLAMGRKDISVEQSARQTPKVARIISDTQKHLAEKPDNQVVLYSNLVHGGVDVLSSGLDQAGIPHALFIGKGTEVGPNKVTDTTRQQGVNDYLAGKKRVIVLSGAGAEGLSLGNSTMFASLDNSWNPERILQAEARARRLGGQSQRAPQDRVVQVNRYEGVAAPSAQPNMFMRAFGAKAPRTTDEYVLDVAKNKINTNRAFTQVLKHPNKYLRKEVSPTTGHVRYVYKEPDNQGLWGRIFGGR